MTRPAIAVSVQANTRTVFMCNSAQRFRNGFAEPRDREPKSTLSRPQPAPETARPVFEPRKRPQIAKWVGGAHKSAEGALPDIMRNKSAPPKWSKLWTDIPRPGDDIGSFTTEQAWPAPGHPDQQGPVTAAHSRTRRRTPQGDAELMAEEQVLGFKPARRLEEVNDEHCERM